MELQGGNLGFQAFRGLSESFISFANGADIKGDPAEATHLPFSAAVSFISQNFDIPVLNEQKMDIQA